MTVALAILTLCAAAAPHLLRVDRIHPAAAASLWLTALAARALAAVSAAAFATLGAPSLDVFTLLTHWCVHTVVPLVGLHIDLQGHHFGYLAVLLPAVLISGSLVVATLRLARSHRALATAISRTAIGTGPGESLIVAGGDVLIAAAGIVRPRIVVSAGALASFDDDELAAGFAHERAHVFRRHHLVLTFVAICTAVARFLPGTRRAAAEVRFQLERDADQWAIAQTHNPLALASAICKAAGSSSVTGHAVAALSGGGVERRVVDLIRSDDQGTRSIVRRGVDGLTVVAACVALSAMALLSASAVASAAGTAPSHTDHHCSASS